MTGISSTLFLIVLLILIIRIINRGKNDDTKSKTERKQLELIEKIKRIHKRSKHEQEEKYNELPKDVDEFFNGLPSETKYNDALSGVYFGSSNFSLFRDFAANTKNSLDIITNTFEDKTLIKIISSLRDKKVRIRIITRTRKRKGYLEKIKKYFNGITLEPIKRYNQMHAKIIIRDGEKLLVGSSNLTDASSGETERFYDANTIINNSEDVALAKIIFDSLWDNKDKLKNLTETNLLFSKKDENCLPYCLKPFFTKEKEEIILVMGSGLIDKSILDRIREWNRSVKIKLITGEKWIVKEISPSKLETMRYLKDLSEESRENFLIQPKQQDIHAKLYIFKNQKIAIISSQNLTIDSWQSLFELGYVIKDEKQVNDLINKVNNLHDGKFENLENLIEIDKPLSSWDGTSKEKKKKIPWDLAEADPEWKIEKEKSDIFYKMHRNKLKGETMSGTKNIGIEKFEADFTTKQRRQELLRGESTDPIGFMHSPVSHPFIRKKGKRFYEKELEIINKFNRRVTEKDKKWLEDQINKPLKDVSRNEKIRDIESRKLWLKKLISTGIMIEEATQKLREIEEEEKNI